jgi:hypothetical protein
MEYTQASTLFPLQEVYFQAYPNIDALSNYAWFDSINLKFHLTGYEREMIAKNGFVVSQRLRYGKFVDALDAVYAKDIPVMITTDMMLFALHASYDAILKKLEIEKMRPNLVDLLTKMQSSYSEMAAKYSSYPQLNNSLNDVDIYISIPLALLGKTNSTVNPLNQSEFEVIMSQINAEGYADMSLFSEHVRHIDFSQFKPRGHYTDEFLLSGSVSTLSDYFKAMMWLGRIDFLLTPPPAAGEPPWTKEDIWRMNASAALLDESIDLADARNKLDENDHIIELLVGSQDNLSPTELHSILKSTSINDASDLIDSSKYAEFKKQLVATPGSDQKILSDVFMMNPSSQTPDTLPVSFKLSGQRFIIDSYFFSQLVYDRIIFNGQKIWRPLPSTLDACFILGNNDALNLLKDEINTYNYATQLSSLRTLTDLFDTAFWQQSLYNSWLNCIRQLNKKPTWEGMPFFLSSAAWQHEKINTQLASWSQLRHDNILYVKPSYTGSMGCSYPYSYIEPYPLFYMALSSFAVKAKEFFSEVVANPVIENYFTTLSNTCNSIKRILDKQMSGVQFTNEETSFLQSMLFKTTDMPCLPPVYTGWYKDLLFDAGKESVVADVHTQPTDEAGNIVGNVLHAGTGEVNLGIFMARGPAPENKLMAFAGPLMSYYETVTSNFSRYNDKEWDTVYTKLTRPDWTSIYLAGKLGNTLQKGRELPYSIVENNEAVPKIQSENSYVQLYPNPGNGMVNLKNLLPHTEVIIFDLQGRIVIQAGNIQNNLDLTSLPPGMYILIFKGNLQSRALSYIKL